MRAVRAGSIGREEPEFDERAESPERRREALAPAPPRRSHCLMVPSVTSGPEGQGTAWLAIGLRSGASFPPVTEWLPNYPKILRLLKMRASGIWMAES